MDIDTVNIKDIERALATLRSAHKETFIDGDGKKNKEKNDAICNYLINKTLPAERILEYLLDAMKENCTFERVFKTIIRK